MGIPSRKASPMPLMACVTPAAGTITSVPIVPPLVRLIPSAAKAAPASCVTRTGWIFSDWLSSS